MLALITGAWIVRDISAADGLAGFWRHWASGSRQGFTMPTQVTSPFDGALFAVYAGTAVAVLRSSVPASALLAAAVFTLAVRLPSLWVLTGSWAYLQPTDSMRTRALLSTFAVLGLAVGLGITAVAGRRPPEATGQPRGPRAAPRSPVPTRPTVLVAWLAGPLLLLDAAVTAVWQIHFAYQVGPELYLESVTGGERIAQRLLAPPPGWLAATVVVLGTAAGVGLLARAVFSRPLGAVLAVNVLASGAVGLDFAVRTRVLENFTEVPLEYRFVVATSFLELIAGPVLIVLLTRRGESRPGDDPWPDGNRPPPGHGSPQPAYGYGYPPARPGYGYPPPGPRQPGTPPGPPPAGGFGPPPPSSPPPNW